MSTRRPLARAAAAAAAAVIAAALLAGCGGIDRRAGLSAPATALAPAGPAPRWSAADAPRLGQPADAATLARLDRTVFPDGRGLPPGRGTAAEGERLYRRHCQACHGAGAQGGTADELVGDPAAADPGARTLAAYWPYATTLFDFIRRAMPMTAPGSLRDDEVYALSAYLLATDGLWPRDQPLDGPALAALRMPHRAAFRGVDAPFPAGHGAPATP